MEDNCIAIVKIYVFKMNRNPGMSKNMCSEVFLRESFDTFEPKAAIYVLFMLYFTLF